MKKSISICIGLLLGIVALIGAFGCSSGTQNELRGKVDSLQSQLEDMNGRLKEMDEQLRERDERIAQLEEELREMRESSGENHGSTMLDKDLENRIKQDYFEQFGYNFHYDCFYGNYGDCAVFFVSGDAAVVKTITIAGVSFQYGYDWEIYVWQNGQFKTLEEAYSANWLTQEDIESIANVHNEFVKNK